jgi:hypothetical protein
MCIFSKNWFSCVPKSINRSANRRLELTASGVISLLARVKKWSSSKVLHVGASVYIYKSIQPWFPSSRELKLGHLRWGTLIRDRPYIRMYPMCWVQILPYACDRRSY